MQLTRQSARNGVQVAAIPRRRKLSERHESQCVARVGRFVKFLSAHCPRLKEMAEVQDTMAAEFMAAEERRGASPETYTDTLKLLRSCFSRLRKAAGIAENPFEGIPASKPTRYIAFRSAWRKYSPSRTQRKPIRLFIRSS